jgi:hypothetical protein
MEIEEVLIDGSRADGWETDANSTWQSGAQSQPETQKLVAPWRRS